MSNGFLTVLMKAAPLALLLGVACAPGVQPKSIESSEPGDVRLTTALRDELIAEPRLAFVSRTLEISTRQRRVSLHGTVTKDEHALIIDRAQAVAGAAQVDDRLEVK